MFIAALLPVLLALGAAAEPASLSHVRRALDNAVSTHLEARQSFTADSLPQECRDQCSSTLTIYNACLNNDQTTCLTVCSSDTFNSFVGCFQCVITNTPNFPSSTTSVLQSTIDNLESACAAAGTTPSVTVSLAGASGSASGAAPSATGSDLVTVSGAGASASASASGIAASASSAASAIASGASSAAGVASSSGSRAAGGAASSASSAVAAPSGAASRLGANAGAWALGAVGVAAGLAF